MGLHVAQMTSQQGIRDCFDAVTTNAAKVMHLQGYGLEAGCDASFVLLQARDPIEAIRLRANRLKVWKRGKLVAQTAEVVAKLHVPGRPNAVDIGKTIHPHPTLGESIGMAAEVVHGSCTDLPPARK